MDYRPSPERQRFQTRCVAHSNFSGQLRCPAPLLILACTLSPAFSDLPAEERWTHIGNLYSNKTAALIDYIDNVCPKWLTPFIKVVGDDLDRYRGFGERRDEMKGYAKALGVPLGYLAFSNLFYQLEGIGED